MLLAQVQSHQLNVDADSLSLRVWREQSWGICSLIGDLLQDTSIVHYLLRVAHLNLTENELPACSDRISAIVLANAVKRIADHYHHCIVNEVHLLYGLHDTHPVIFDRYFESLRTQYRSKFPKGSRQQQKYLERANDSGNEWLSHKLLAWIDETPLSSERVLKSLNRYLASTDYPYGSVEWRAYLEKKRTAGENWRPVRDGTAIGFGAHQLRNAKNVTK
jgi:hypothetical protein